MEKGKAMQAEAMGKRAQLILANMYRIKPSDGSVTAEDWDNDGAEVVITFNTQKYRTPKEECDALFEKARKLRRGSVVIAELLQQVSVSAGLGVSHGRATRSYC